MPTRTAARRTAAFLISAALAVGTVALATPAQAAPDCTPGTPYSEFEGTSMEFVYAAAAPIGGSATIQVPELCVRGSAVVTVLSNADDVTVDVVGDGSFASGVTLTAPAVDFEGIARVDLQIVDGTTSFVLELYALFGVAPTEFAVDRPAPVSTAVSAPAFFPLSGIDLREGASISAELIRTTQPLTIRWVDAPEPGIEVTPSTSYRGAIGIEVLLTDGISATRVTLFQWAGVPIPTGIVWAPNPPPVAIEPGGTGAFDLSGGFAPRLSECEIRVTTSPDVEVVVGPPSLQGVAFDPVFVEVRDPDFVGLLTVSYDLSCRTPAQEVSSVEYDLLLYVGIPIPQPELADTGAPAGAVPMGLGALAAVLLGALLLGRSVRARVGSASF